MSGEPDPKTEELRIEQLEREREERGRDDEANQRRADKAAYLREKLEEREDAERED